MMKIIVAILAGAIATPSLAEPVTQAVVVVPTTIAVPVGTVSTTVTTTKDTPVGTASPKRRGHARPQHQRALTRHRMHTQGWKVSQEEAPSRNPAADAKWRNRAKSNVKFGNKTPTTTTTTTTTVVPAVAVVPTVIIKPAVTPKAK
jgi:hypothetical protein